MKKATFVVFVVVAILCVALLGFTGCSSDEKGKVFTSTAVNGHIHTVLIPNKDFANPPDEKVYTTSKGSDGHTHQIILRQVNFSNINRGIAETRFTSPGSNNHSHQFVIK